MTLQTRFTPQLAQAPLVAYGFDPFEEKLLAILRHLVTEALAPGQASWHRAFVIAGETWGEQQGLAVAHALWSVVRELIALRGAEFAFNDPLDIDMRGLVTVDESQLLAMLHHMRRDETAAARDAVEELTHGRMDPDLIRAALAFADRFPSGARQRLRGHPPLRVVG